MELAWSRMVVNLSPVIVKSSCSPWNSISLVPRGNESSYEAWVSAIQIFVTNTCQLPVVSSDTLSSLWWLFLPQVMSSQRVVRSLLSFVVQNDKAVGEWSSAQFEELQLLVGGAGDRACCMLCTGTHAHKVRVVFSEPVSEGVWKMAHPMLTRDFLQPATAAPMCTPQPPIPPFLLT